MSWNSGPMIAVGADGRLDLSPGAGDDCTDPPAESCADAECPVHADQPWEELTEQAWAQE